MDGFFEKSGFKKVTKNKKISYISLFICIIIVTAIVMLISCKFKYGILVVGSSSMAGTIDNETIYYTKGTNNQQQDEGYRTDNDIIGVVKFKIMLIGWPTIWLNDWFHK